MREGMKFSWRNLQNAHLWLTLCVQMRREYSLWRQDENKEHHKKSQRDHRELPTQLRLTKIGMWVVVADVVNHSKFSDDRSKEYELLHRNGLSPAAPARLCFM